MVVRGTVARPPQRNPLLAVRVSRRSRGSVDVAVEVNAGTACVRVHRPAYEVYVPSSFTQVLAELRLIHAFMGTALPRLLIVTAHLYPLDVLYVRYSLPTREPPLAVMSHDVAIPYPAPHAPL